MFQTSNPTRSIPVTRIQIPWIQMLLGVVLLGYLGTGGAADLRADEANLESVLYLIGDAGIAGRGSPVLAQLREDVVSIPEGVPTVVAFLGDNIYPDGFRTDSKHYETDRGYLEAQIDVVRGTKARAIFLAGNHDWAVGGKHGLERLVIQDKYLAAQAINTEADVAMIPSAGCPGPESIQLGNSALLVFLDTQWWLHGHERSSAACAEATEEEVLEQLRAILDAATLPVVVLAHHPLQTRGTHRGTFWKGLLQWVGAQDQDLPNRKYREMRESLMGLFREFEEEPRLYAAGHDHNLQVFDGAPYGIAGLHLVSGAGSKITRVKDDPSLDFYSDKRRGEMGFMRLEFLTDGSIELKVLTDGTQEGAGFGARVRYEAPVLVTGR